MATWALILGVPLLLVLSISVAYAIQNEVLITLTFGFSILACPFVTGGGLGWLVGSLVIHQWGEPHWLYYLGGACFVPVLMLVLVLSTPAEDAKQRKSHQA